MIFYFFLILPVFSINWLETLENTLDRNVGVCDNLYRHVCPLNKTDGFSQIIYQEFQKDFEKYKIPENLIKIKVDLTKLHESTKNNRSIDEILEKSEKLCRENRDEFKRFLESLENLYNVANIPCYPNCFTSVLEYENCTEAFEFLLPEFEQLFTVDPRKIRARIIAVDVIQSYEWYKNNTKAYDRINSTVVIVKAVAAELLPKTPWIKNRNLTKIFDNITRKLNLIDVEVLRNMSIEYFNEFQTEFDKCTNIIPAEFSSICYPYTINSVKKGVILGFNSQPNAFNGHPIMGVGLTFAYYATIDLPPAFFLGSVAQVIGHEIGHTFIVSKRGDNYLPYFSNDTRNCIQNQMIKSCEYFAEGDCDTFDAQFDENGSDSFSYQIMYEIFKAFYGENMNDKIAGSKTGMTNLQLYFYSHGTTLCNPKPSTSYRKGTHHASVVRVNSGATQNLDFGKTFNCAPNSRMIESRAEKCYVFGENAAQTRF